MRTTLDLDDDLVARAKAAATRERTTLTRLIEEGLRLRMRAPERQAAPAALPVYEGRGGLRVGIDPLSNASMLDAADEADFAGGTLR